MFKTATNILSEILLTHLAHPSYEQTDWRKEELSIFDAEASKI